MSLLGRRSLALFAGALAFGLATLASVAIAPYALGLLYGCIPPVGSCGDSVGWAMIISAPISIPLTIVIATICAVLAYRRAMHVKSA